MGVTEVSRGSLEKNYDTPIILPLPLPFAKVTSSYVKTDHDLSPLQHNNKASHPRVCDYSLWSALLFKTPGQAWNYTETTETISSVALVLALVPLLNFPIDFNISKCKCHFQNEKGPYSLKDEIPGLPGYFEGVISYSKVSVSSVHSKMCQ